MKRKFALILALLITLLIIANIFFLNLLKQKKTVYVTKIIDGDTFQSDEKTFRLANINTPEKNEKGYFNAKEYLSKIYQKSVEIEEISTDRYGRTLVRVYAPNYLNLEMVQNGLAKKFLVQESETSIFDRAEKEAVKNQKGLWIHSSKFNCLKTELLAREEIVKIKSICGKINLKDFIVSDESRKKYKFKNLSITEVNLHTTEGSDNETDVFWGVKGDVWNNDRDTFYLSDAEGFIAHHFSYGY